MDKQKEMIEMCKELRLPSIRSLLEQGAIFEQITSPADFLYYALKQEMEDRYVRAKANRIRLANFPEKKLLEELDVEALPQNAADRLTHRAHIINMIGGSYRILETKEWMEQSNF